MIDIVHDLTGIRFTRRGIAVIATAWLITTVAITVSISDVCWTGHGYGSCQQLLHNPNAKGTP